MIPLAGDLAGEVLEREAAAWMHALLCEPAVHGVPAKTRERKRRELRPADPVPSPEARRGFLADGFNRLDVGETAKKLADLQHPTAGVLARLALGYEAPEFSGHRFDHTADRSVLIEATSKAERGVILAAHTAGWMLIVGRMDPALATLGGALRAYRMLCPDEFHGKTNAYARRIWDRYEPVAPLALAFVVGLIGPRGWNSVEMLVGADAIGVELLAIDAQRPARWLFGDRDVFWRVPPALTARFAIKLRIPADQALVAAVCTGETDPVAVLSGRGKRTEQSFVKVTANAGPASLGDVDPHYGEAADESQL